MDKKAVAHVAALSVVLLALAVAALAPRTFFTNDTGLRFLQVRTLVDSGWRTAAVSYPSDVYDPQFEHVPYYYAYNLFRGEMYLSITPVFPLLLSLFYAAFGWFGMALPMVLGGVLTAMGVLLLGRAVGLERPFLWMWLSVLGTPVIFYTLQPWDHSLATGMATLGVALTATSLRPLDKKKQVVGGLLIALTFAQRPELVLFALCAGLALLVVKRRALLETVPFVLGGVLGTAVSFTINQLWQGHPLGFPLASQLFDIGVPPAYPVQPYSEVTLTRVLKVGRLLFTIEARDPLTFFAALLMLTAILLFFFGLRIPKYQKSGVLYTAFVCTALAFMLWGIAGWSQALTGLITTLPILPLAAAVPPNHSITKQPQAASRYHFITLTPFLTIALTLLIWPSFGGEQWGARYMLTVYPLLLFLGAVHLAHYRRVFDGGLKTTVSRITVGLVVLLVLFQAVGVRLLFDRLYDGRAARKYVADLDAELILTNHPFLPSFMTTLEAPQFFYVDDQSDLSQLIIIAYEEGVRQIAILPLETDQLEPPGRAGPIAITPIGRDSYRLSDTP